MIESMIFLAISAIMFVGVIGIFQGTQQSTEFSQAVREFENSLNGILNDTQAGVFPSVTNVSCQYVGASRFPTYTVDSGAIAGDNNGCIFVGKIIQFGDGTDDESYPVHTVIGKNIDFKSGTVSNNEEYFNVLYNSGTPNIDTTDINTTKWGLRIKHAFIRQGASTLYVWGAGAFYLSFGADDAASIGSQSSTATMTLYAVTPDGVNARSLTNARTTQAFLKSNLGIDSNRDMLENQKNPIIVCLEGSAGDEAVIEIGSSDGGLNAVAKFEEVAECNP